MSFIDEKMIIFNIVGKEKEKLYNVLVKFKKMKSKKILKCN